MGIRTGIQGRIALTVYYALVCALAIRRLILFDMQGNFANQLSHLELGVFAALALSGWYVLREFRRMSDRIAAFLYGVYYAMRVGAYFASPASGLLLAEASCAVISAGTLSVMIGLVQCISSRAVRQPGNQ